MSEINLEKGKSYRRHDGKRVDIVADDYKGSRPTHRFVGITRGKIGDTWCTYTESGDAGPSDLQIDGPWVNLHEIEQWCNIYRTENGALVARTGQTPGSKEHTYAGGGCWVGETYIDTVLCVVRFSLEGLPPDTQTAVPAEAPRMKAIVCIGPPGAGKSTYAAQHPELTEINRDNVRWELFGDRSCHINEGAVTLVCYAKIRANAGLGQDVIVSGTNLNPRFRQQLVEYLEAVGYAVELKFFWVPLEELITRNEARERPVPRIVIEQMHRRMREQFGD